MDQMPHGLIDSIRPFLGYHKEIDGIYYGKAIFLFLKKGKPKAKRELQSHRICRDKGSNNC